MITQAVEYSLRAMVTLAKREGQPCTAQLLAELTDTPVAYLSKLMQVLVRAELVNSRRGVNGGFILAKKPAAMTIFDVVQAVEPIKRIRQCPLKISEHAGVLCPLHRRLDAAIAMVEHTFRETTLADLLNESEGRRPLCDRSSPITLRIDEPGAAED
ncbi:MAG: transcriptional regulator [Planctomycetota bacterium]|nr:MAG: transcriptional regulator [Planctomycetota bacterium]